MGKGRWQHGAANCNHTEPNGQQPEPETQHELSEPCALQGARTVHRGGKCREAPTYATWAVRTLEIKDEAGRRQQRTPALAAGLADPVWTLKEWLTYPAKLC